MIYSVYSYEDPLYHPVVVIKDEQRFWKRILIVDDEEDIILAFKVGIKDSKSYTNRKIEVHTSNNPVIALSEFKPDFYDLRLVDINMPYMNGFELCEKILAININDVQLLQKYGYVSSVNWDKLGNDTSTQIQHWAANVDVYNVHSLFHTLGIPVSSGVFGRVCKD